MSRNAQVTGISQHHMPTASGLSDYDYQNLSNLTMGIKNLNQLELINKIPIPPEIMEHFKSEFGRYFRVNFASSVYWMRVFVYFQI